MKLTKYLFILSMLFIGFTACDDDETEDPQGGSGSGTAEKVAVSFAETGRTVLRNGGQVQIPIRLEKATTETVRVNIGVEDPADATVAEEGIDFNIEEKVINIAAGDTLAYLMVDVFDDGKANNDKSVNFTINSVYGAGVKAEANQNFTLQITSNAFVEFQYENRETTEGAGTYAIPVLVTGSIEEQTTVQVRVKEGGTAQEGTHFTIETPTLTLEPGATSASVEIALTDDEEANADRWFDLEIVSVDGSNAIIGSRSLCRVTIVSEEVLKYISFGAATYTVKEGDEIYIPVYLDKAPSANEDVRITFSVRQQGTTAEENVDFTIEGLEVTFVEGQLEGELVIRTEHLEALEADKLINLGIRATVGANIGDIQETVVTIQDIDLPVFSQSRYEVEEAWGSYLLPVTIQPQVEDVTLHVAIASNGTATEGTHYQLVSEYVTIPAGSTTANVEVNIGYEEEWTVNPSFTLYLSGANENMVWDATRSYTTVSLVQTPFRSLLGNWLCEVQNADNCAAVTNATIENVSFGEEVRVNLPGFWNGDAYTTYFNMRYNKEDRTLSIVLNQRCEDHNWNFNAGAQGVILRFLWAPDINLTSINMSNWDIENGVITFPDNGQFGGGGAANGAMTGCDVWGWLFRGGTLTKQ